MQWEKESIKKSERYSSSLKALIIRHEVRVIQISLIYQLESVKCNQALPKKKKRRNKGRDVITKASTKEFTRKKNKFPLWELL